MEQAYPEKARELLKDLVRVCSNSPQAAAALIHDNLEQLWPSLQGASSQSLPKLQLLQEQRVLLASSPHPQKLIEKIEQLKDAGYIYLICIKSLLVVRSLYFEWMPNLPACLYQSYLSGHVM